MKESLPDEGMPKKHSIRGLSRARLLRHNNASEKRGSKLQGVLSVIF